MILEKDLKRALSSYKKGTFTSLKIIGGAFITPALMALFITKNLNAETKEVFIKTFNFGFRGSL